MKTETSLHRIRTNLFYGLLSYTKSFPDFSIPQRFTMASPKEGGEILKRLTKGLNDEKEILLYVHLPFCSSECVFCNAFPQKSNKEIQDRYLSNLLEEIRIYSASRVFEGRIAKCLYLGGGTPTSFSRGEIQRIIDELRSALEIPEDCNITCEAHSKDLRQADRIGELSDLGVNRISIGCQTFDKDVLDLCKRTHHRSQVKEVIQNAKGAGLSTNIDMMIGLPGQQLEGLKRDLDILSDIAPDSIEYMRHEIVNPLAMSLYRNNPNLLVQDDELFRMTFETQRWMEAKGYEQNGHFTSEKQFPYRYHWLKEMPFIALGSRSRSYTKSLCCDKHEDLSLYFRLIERGTPPIARYMVLSKTDQMYRSLLLNLQIRSGLDLRTFEERFGESALGVFSPTLQGLAENGCVEQDGSAIRLSRYGRYFVEDVCCYIIDQAVAASEPEARLKRMSHSSGAFAERRASRRRIPEGG